MSYLNNTLNNTLNTPDSDEDKIKYSVLSLIMLVIISLALAILLFIIIMYVIPGLYEDCKSEKIRTLDIPQSSEVINNDYIFNNLDEIIVLGNKEILDYTCPICIQNICKSDDIIVQLECNHIFHKNCLESWYNSNSLNNSKSCPLCRNNIIISNIIQ